MQKRITQLFIEHGSQVYAYAYRRTRVTQEAEDIVAETYLIALHRVDRVPERALPWLIGTARWVLANRSRTVAKEQEALADLRAAHEPTYDPFEAVTALVAFEEAFSCMNADDREVLMLVDWDGLSNKEAAAVIGCNTATFAVRLHRARRRLGEVLEGDAAVMSYVIRSGVMR